MAIRSLLVVFVPSLFVGRVTSMKGKMGISLAHSAKLDTISTKVKYGIKSVVFHIGSFKGMSGFKLKSLSKPFNKSNPVFHSWNRINQ